MNINVNRLELAVCVMGRYCTTLIALIWFLGFASSLSAEDLLGPPPLLTEVRDALEVGSRQRALSIVETSEKSKDDKKYIPYALLDIARSFYEAKNLKKSEEILSKITSQYSDSPVASLAWCGLGEVYRELGDDKLMVAALSKGMVSPRVGTSVNIMDASETQNRAHELLGGHYMTTLHWREALAVWEDWKPSSWCGTCEWSMDLHRRTNITICQLQLGQHTDFVQPVVNHLRRNTKDAWRVSGYQAYLTFLVYERAGQTKELSALVRAAEARVKTGQTDTVIEAIRYCEQLRKLESRAAIGPLIELLGAGERYERPVSMNPAQWRNRAAADALARSGPKAVSGLVQALKNGGNAKKGAVTAPTPWLYYSLGRHPSGAALEALKAAKLRDNASWTEFGDLYFALALKGEKGAVARKHLDSVHRDESQLVQREVTRGIVWVKIEQEWPLPKMGSLPNKADPKKKPPEELPQK